MAKKINLTNAQFAQRWKDGIQNSSAKTKAGIEAVTEAPGVKAAEQADLWLQKVTASKDKYKRNVAAVSLSDWKTAAITKGIPAMATAATLGAKRVEAVAGKIISTINTAVESLPARGATLEQNINRVTHMARALQTAFSE